MSDDDFDQDQDKPPTLLQRIKIWIKDKPKSKTNRYFVATIAGLGAIATVVAICNPVGAPIAVTIILSAAAFVSVSYLMNRQINASITFQEVSQLLPVIKKSAKDNSEQIKLQKAKTRRLDEKLRASNAELAVQKEKTQELGVKLNAGQAELALQKKLTKQLDEKLSVTAWITRRFVEVSVKDPAERELLLKDFDKTQSAPVADEKAHSEDLLTWDSLRSESETVVTSAAPSVAPATTIAAPAMIEISLSAPTATAKPPADDAQEVDDQPLIEKRQLSFSK
jgi:hypothetical protein